MKLSSQLEQLAELDREIAELKERRTGLIDRIVAQHHPLKVGDVVEVNGYSHDGKKMRVERLSFNPAPHSYIGHQWKARGPVLRADGSKGAYLGKWYEAVDHGDS